MSARPPRPNPTTLMRHAGPRTAAYYDSPYAPRSGYAQVPTMTRTAADYYPPQPRAAYEAPLRYGSPPRTATRYARGEPRTEFDVEYAAGPRTAWDYSDMIPFRTDYGDLTTSAKTAAFNAGSMAAMGLAGSGAYAAGSYLMGGGKS